MFNRGLFLSRCDEWGTPRELFAALDREFSFTLDVCALPFNAKCDRFFTPSENGLRQSWDGEVCWCNPPYGRKIGAWVSKAYNSQATVVLLLPARTDTRWFHDYIYNQAEIRFLRGRIRFEDANGVPGDRAPFPSMVVIYRAWGN